MIAGPNHRSKGDLVDAAARRIESQTSLDAKFDIPLVVDLDRTPVLTDTSSPVANERIAGR
jgi:hypothetical protein